MQYPVTLHLFALIRRPIAVVALLLAGCSQTELPTASGTPVVWEQLRGEWVLVNYWAEWCKPCLQEIPELNALDRAADVSVLGVNFDGVSVPALNDLRERMGIEFTLLTRDPGPDFGWQLPMALPATFVVTPEGDLLEARFGPQTEAQLRELMSR
ncbi:MAG: TlpA disulfide reductase family protein [Marinobacter sp.]|uniref:TlpA family protein disulfide reductase n=1 Tax=Marinobacter sp. TaxID=50741 RepID=UPI00299EBA3A|nr:TlpA disulfide reductase family protein [Marinobacter sp.]MDX1757659.1 TlpA disulfide reductase family protein [Marinobacter sp.]